MQPSSDVAAGSSGSAVSLTAVTKIFANGVQALGPVDLAIAAGEFVSLLGPSGCGKSTALRLIAGLTQPTSGRVQVAATASHRRRSIGFVFQEPTLMPWATVWDNVYLPLRLQRRARADVGPRIDETIASVGLSEFANVYPRELSGGMKMRVSLARALVTDPDRVGVSLAARRGDDAAPRTGRRGVQDRGRGAARRGVSHLGRLRRPLPQRVRGARAHGRHEGGVMTVDVQPQSASQGASRLRFALPVLTFAIGILVWDLIVRLNNLPPYQLPGPFLVFATLVQDWRILFDSLVVTLVTTFEGFAAAAVGGIALAFLFNRSRLIEYSLYPYAVILQVTPVIAIAPLLLIYLPQQVAVVVCAWIVAFFPVLANTTLGLNSVDRNLKELFALYGASAGQTLWQLKLPSALPHILGGLRVAGGLSLIGAVVAEIAAGSAGAGSGLAYRIAESGYRLNIPRMFAALLLLSVAGIVIFMGLSLVSHLVLRRWHESALGKES
jgi:NitT/TauT family transport system permease protein